MTVFLEALTAAWPILLVLALISLLIRSLRRERQSNPLSRRNDGGGIFAFSWGDGDGDGGDGGGGD